MQSKTQSEGDLAGMQETSNIAQGNDHNAEAAAPQGERRRKGEHLDHFYKMKRKDAIETKASLMENLSEAIDDLKRKSAEKGGKMSISDVAKVAFSYNKLVMLGLLAVLLIVAAIFIVPNIPLQVQRSAGFAAFQAQDYPKAFNELKAYIEARPSDSDAVYTAARAALFSQNIDYGRKLINQLYKEQLLPVASGIGYYYALVNPTSSDAVDALSSLIRQNPQYAAARLLRGYLLEADANSIRQARDDFLQLDEILRGEEGEEEILFLHRYLQESDQHHSLSKVPHYEGVVASPLFESAGFGARLDGLIYQLQLSRSDAFLDEILPATAIANVYFVYMLINQNELEEARSVLTGLTRTHPTALAVMQASAVLALREGDFAAAQKAFGDILEQVSEDYRTVNNYALMQVLHWQSERGRKKKIDPAPIAELYKPMIDAQNVGIVELNNGASFLLLSGELDFASQLLGKIADADSSRYPHISFNRALIDWHMGDDRAALKQLQALSANDIPNVDFYIAVIHANSGDLDTAIDLLLERSGSNPEDEDLLFKRIELMNENGDWRLAYIDVQKFLTENPNNLRGRYLLGQLALRLNNEQVFSAQLRALKAAQAEEDGYYADALEGASMFRQGNVLAASRAYLNSVRAAPAGPRRNNLAILWADIAVEDRRDEVAAELAPLVAENNHPELKALLSYALAVSDPPTAARLAVDAVKSADGGSYLAKLYAGGALVEIGNHRDGLPLLESAVNEWPAQSRALQFLQRGYTAAGRIDEAREAGKVLDYLSSVARGEGPQTQASYRVFVPKIRQLSEAVRVALGSGDPDQRRSAQVTYEKAANEAEGTSLRSDILYSRATFESYYKDYNQSIKFFEEALALGLDSTKKQVEALLFYAEVLSLNNDYGKSAQVLRQVIELGGPSLLHQRLLAIALANDGQLKEATEQMNMLLEHFPADRETYYDLAGVYSSQQEYDLSVLTLKRLLLIDPNFAPAYRLLAEIYSLTGKAHRAKLYSNAYATLG